MWWLFKRRKHEGVQEAEPESGAAQSKLEQAGRRLADRLERRMSGIPRLKLKIMFIAYFLVMGGFCASLIVEGLTGRQREAGFSVSPISIPKQYQQAPDGVGGHVPAISEEEYRQVQGFRRYFDSLATSPSGLAIRDSIVKTRPGLLDSLGQIEQAYQRQQKGK